MRRFLLPSIGLAWLAVVISGTFLMMHYANSPGKGANPPSKWPDSSQVSPDPKRPTLVMFIHPRCPCSRSTIGELAQLMAHCQGRVNAHVFFLQPDGMTADWVHSDTWRGASEIPGVTIHSDPAGAEAQRFQSETSGQTLLYNAKGKLAFNGGITLSRGHSGDNPGRRALQALLFNEEPGTSQTPVFGCSLTECHAATGL